MDQKTTPAPGTLAPEPSPTGVVTQRSLLALAAELAGVPSSDVAAYLAWYLSRS